MKYFGLLTSVICALTFMSGHSAYALTKKTAAPKKQAAIQKGTTVSVKTEAKGLYDQECYDIYYEVINGISGGLLILIGILMATGLMGQFLNLLS